MLDNETVADSGSIQWLDGEDAFVILDQNKFEKVCSAKVVALLLTTPFCFCQYALTSLYLVSHPTPCLSYS